MAPLQNLLVGRLAFGNRDEFPNTMTINLHGIELKVNSKLELTESIFRYINQWVIKYEK